MSIQWVDNRIPKTDDRFRSVMSPENVQKARLLHASFPQYSQTPLAALSDLARDLGVGGIFVKDESYRFGLNAFKALGGSFAIACYIADALGKDMTEVDYSFLISTQCKDQLGQVTFFSATDGNHGKGVAWAAKQLGQKAVIRMPKGSSLIRLNSIAKEGAVVTIEDANYDECVRIAAREASQTPQGVVIQDTSWAGYETIPIRIIQGYGTMAVEASEQLREAGVHQPTHVFVQAGVGSLAAAVLGYFSALYLGHAPVSVVMEAEEANCLYQSAKAADGHRRIVEGDLNTIMAGLACGEPNPIAWDLLRNHASFFVSCPDWVASLGMRILGAPLKGDMRVISGESGAVGVGLLVTLMKDHRYQNLRQALRLDRYSQVLLFSTEGDTDPDSYRNVVWNGYLPYRQA